MREDHIAHFLPLDLDGVDQTSQNLYEKGILKRDDTDLLNIDDLTSTLKSLKVLVTRLGIKSFSITQNPECLNDILSLM